jgi:hypothetical protein
MQIVIARWPDSRFEVLLRDVVARGPRTSVACGHV